MEDILDKIKIKVDNIKIAETVMQQWQQLLDLLMDFSEAQDALITSYQEPYLRIEKGSSNPDNIFSEGDRFKVEQLYCNQVIDKKTALEINNAASIKKWQNSIYLEKGLIAYLGYPILWPTGEIYGTVCLHANQQLFFADLVKKQLGFIKNLIESDLEIIYQNHLNISLRKYYAELIDNLPVGVMIEDQNGKILKVNKAMLFFFPEA